jgi:adenylate cyclase
MHDDEEATHARLTALLADVVDPTVAEHGGRTVKNTGDGFLAEFPSAVQAVRAAVRSNRSKVRSRSHTASKHAQGRLAQPLNDEYLSQPSLDRAIQLVRLAIELDPKLTDAYAELGYTIVRKREFDAAAAAAERAIGLNPNFADYRHAFVFFAVGEHVKAIEIAKTQMRLDPFHPHFAPLMAGEAFYMLGQYHEALHWLRDAIGRTPNHQYGHAWLAATYAQLGQLANARAEAAEVSRINPKYSIKTHERTAVFKRAEDTENLVDGLRKAGLPE